MKRVTGLAVAIFMSTVCNGDGQVTGESESAEYRALLDSYGKLGTIAGKGEFDKGSNRWLPAFEGAKATEVELSNPHITMQDDAGNYYIADKQSHRILKVDPKGILTTHAGSGQSGFNREEGKATEIHLSYPNGLYVLPNGVVYILDNYNDRVRRVDQKGHLKTVFEDPAGFHHGRGLWVSADEKLIYYVGGAPRGSRLMKWTNEGGSVEIAGEMADLAYLDVDSKGNIIVTEQGANLVHRISPDGERKETIAGNGSKAEPVSGRPATEIGLFEVRGVALRPDGSFFLCTHKGGDVIFVDTKGIAHKFIDGRGSGNVRHGDGSPVDAPGDKISEPRAVTLAPNGDLIITCNDHGFVRLVRKKK